MLKRVWFWRKLGLNQHILSENKAGVQVTIETTVGFNMKGMQTCLHGSEESVYPGAPGTLELASLGYILIPGKDYPQVHMHTADITHSEHLEAHCERRGTLPCL